LIPLCEIALIDPAVVLFQALFAGFFYFPFLCEKI